MPENLLEQITKFFRRSRSSALGKHRVLFICMGLSFLVWFFVKMTQTYESRGVLAMNFQPPIGRVFAEPPPRSMPFKFSGTGWNLLTLGLFGRQPSLDFSLTNAPIQSISRTDISQKIEEELRLRLLELPHEEVTIYLDSLFSKKVSIKLDTTLSYPNGYFIRDSVMLTPDSVTIFGAEQTLADIDWIKTEPLKMFCPETDFEKTLTLINPNPELLQISAARTEMYMPVEQFTEKKLTLPILVLNAKDSIRLIPSTVELSCVVGVSRFNEIKPSDFRLVAVFGGETGPSGTASIIPLLLVRQPAWVRATSFSPRAVEYLIVQ